MNRPEVRIIQSQEEISSNPVDSWEAEQILRKYGYENTNYSNIPPQQQTTPSNNLTFEEMIALEEQRINSERLVKQHKLNGPKPITFDDRNGYHTETKYGSDDDSGYGFKINIVSDMPIPKY
jgi:hypothetical protein